MVLQRVHRIEVNPVLPSPPPGWHWVRDGREIGWLGTKEEAEHFMTRADSQRVFDQIAQRQKAAREAREAGQ